MGCADRRFGEMNVRWSQRSTLRRIGIQSAPVLLSHLRDNGALNSKDIPEVGNEGRILGTSGSRCFMLWWWCFTNRVTDEPAAISEADTVEADGFERGTGSLVEVQVAPQQMSALAVGFDPAVGDRLRARARSAASSLADGRSSVAGLR